MTVTFSAPASSANLGPGFDCLALALDLRNELRLSEGTGQLTVEGEGAGELPTDHSNLVARAFELVAPGQRVDWDLHCTNNIPLARGLGSSTAAAALGLMSGCFVAEVELEADALFERLRELDGHPDNAAACTHGGFVLAFTHADDSLEALPLGPADWLAPVLVVPDRQLATQTARAALPAQYTRADVARSIAGIAALTTGLMAADTGLLEDVLHGDVVHEPHRAALVPELAQVREVIAQTSALGATLSGAGPAVLVWCEPSTVADVVATLEAQLPNLRIEALDIAHDGVRVDD